MQFKTLTLILCLLLISACSALKSPSLNFAEVVKNMEGPKISSIEETQAAEANKSLEQRELVKAITLYTQLTIDHPDNMMYQLHLADGLRLQGDIAKAQQTYDIVLKNKKKTTENMLDATEGKGLCYMQEGNFEEAVKSFSTVLNQDAARWRSINGLGVALALTGRPKEAMEYYNIALQLSDNNPTILNNMGLSLAFNGKMQDAIPLLEKASSSLPKGSSERRRVDLNLGLVYGLASRTSDAERTIKPYLSQAAIYNNLGVYALLANDNVKARQYLKKALSSNPTHYQKAWDNLQKVGG